MTTEALERGLTAERALTNALLDVIRQRLDGMDEATHVLNDIVTRVPTDVQKEVAHLRELAEAKTQEIRAVMDEKFQSVSTQFLERDTRQERESKDNKVAVDAAFAAQKEAAAKQDEANAKAIDKSEKATDETIKKLAELVKSTTDALRENYADLKERTVAVEAIRAGIAEARPSADAELAAMRQALADLSTKVSKLV